MELLKLIVIFVILIWLLTKTEDNDFGSGVLTVMCIMCFIAIITQIFS